MHILTGLTYYRPHTSGLTVYAERLARAFARRGHQVTILTSQDDPQLPRREEVDGLTIVRIPPWMRVSKGLLMPGMPAEALRLARKADVINLHMPQLDAAYIAWFGKLLHKPVVLTYHCDLRLPHGLVHALANQVSHVANNVAAWGSDAIVCLTRDYAEHSAYLTRFMDKVHVLDALVELPPASEEDVRAFRQKFGIQTGQRIIGMAARMATEKGVEYLVQALPRVLEQLPEARLLFVGSYQNVVGEEQYAARILPLIEGLKEHWSLLGHLSPVEMTAFFKDLRGAGHAQLEQHRSLRPGAGRGDELRDFRDSHRPAGRARPGQGQRDGQDRAGRGCARDRGRHPGYFGRAGAISRRPGRDQA